MNRAEQLQDQAEFLRSLAKSSRIPGKREQLLRAAEQCELLADTFGDSRERKREPAPLELEEPYFRIPAHKH